MSVTASGAQRLHTWSWNSARVGRWPTLTKVTPLSLSRRYSLASFSTSRALVLSSMSTRRGWDSTTLQAVCAVSCEAETQHLGLMIASGGPQCMTSAFS